MSISAARALLAMLGACGPSGVASSVPGSPDRPDPRVPSPDRPELRDERFVEAIAEAARSYKPWGRVDEAPNIAPGLCRMPMREDYGRASHVRQSKEGPHGTKLYYLWASQSAYRVLPKLPIEKDFTIVKESFAATTVVPEDETLTIDGLIPSPVRWLETDHGKLYVGAPVGLYVMKKVGAGEGTDEGWIYGTVSAAGEVTSAGRVESCMGCHEVAPHGRLFGLQPTKQLVDLAPPGTPSWQDRMNHR